VTATDASASELLPQPLRAAVVTLTGVAHLALLVALGFVGQQVQVLAPLNVDLIPQGDYFVDTVAIAGEAAEPVAPPAAIEPVAAQDPPMAQPASSEASPPEPLPAALPPAPDVRPEDLAAQEKERRLEVERRAEAAEKARLQRQKEKQRRERQQRRALANREQTRSAREASPGGSVAHRAGVANGQASRAARLNYGALIAAELNRHKYYPALARARGETGSVGAVFTVGPSGRIVAHSITRSSGSPLLDGAVHAMMARAGAPSPPGGAFRGSININFNLGQ
jgi:protein TonB